MSEVKENQSTESDRISDRVSNSPNLRSRRAPRNAIDLFLSDVGTHRSPRGGGSPPADPFFDWDDVERLLLAND